MIGCVEGSIGILHKVEEESWRWGSEVGILGGAPEEGQRRHKFHLKSEQSNQVWPIVGHHVSMLA